MNALGFGLIGTGFMGRAHAIALATVGGVFPEISVPRAAAVADVNEACASAMAARFGFARATTDWRSLLDDPGVEVVDICTPNHLHHEMALAAIAAGKHVWCEKPLALTAAEAEQLPAAATAAGVRHAVGFNYVCNPVIRLARELIEAGELGTLTGFAGRYVEDYLASPDAPFTWRCARASAGAGALADLGSHLINLVHYLLGDIAEVSARLATVHPERRDPERGKARAVENEDAARALVALGSGVTGTLEVSRVATGYKCGLAIEVTGTEGSLAFDQERMNELRLHARGQTAGRAGFTTILAGPEHPDYARFCPAPGHGLGINDLKVIELGRVIQAMETGSPIAADFVEGARVQRVMEAIEASARTRAWVALPPRPAPAIHEQSQGRHA